MVTAAAFLLAADGHPAGEIAVGLVLMGLALELALPAGRAGARRPRRPDARSPAPRSIASSVPDHWAAAYITGLAVAVGIVAARRPLQAPALLLPVMCAGAVGDDRR